MAEQHTTEILDIRHTDDMQDIISAVPSWVLRWGITLFFFILVLIFSLSALIRYPDIVKTSIKIESPNSPKPIVARLSGKLIKILTKENADVISGQALGYLESTANHSTVLNLINDLKKIQSSEIVSKTLSGEILRQANLNELGELQTPYQIFYQEYLNYQSAINNGFSLKKRTILKKDLINLVKQHEELTNQKQLQQKDYALAKQEYEMHQKLEKEKVESLSEFRQQESKYLSKQSPLIQTEASLLSSSSTYSAKEKEILELDNQINEGKLKFVQALYSLISQAEDWKAKYVLTASQSGKISFAGAIQENQVLTINQEVFFVNPGNEKFFGQMNIPQINMGKVKEGQDVLIKLKSYPFQEYGIIRGKITYISDVPYKDSIFTSKVSFKFGGFTDMKKAIHLKEGMIADAEIITKDATILQRITWNFFRIINN